jgi:hypothetical protein
MRMPRPKPERAESAEYVLGELRGYCIPTVSRFPMLTRSSTS